MQLESSPSEASTPDHPNNTQLTHSFSYAQTFVVPSDRYKWRACLKCKLVKTQQQWKTSKHCQNCKDFEKNQGYKTNTSTKFQKFVVLLKGEKSYIRRKVGFAKNIVCGMYACGLEE